MKKASVLISSPSESQNILVSRNVWFITKFDRGSGGASNENSPGPGKVLKIFARSL